MEPSDPEKKDVYNEEEKNQTKAMASPEKKKFSQSDYAMQQVQKALAKRLAEEEKENKRKQRFQNVIKKSRDVVLERGRQILKENRPNTSSRQARSLSSQNSTSKLTTTATSFRQMSVKRTSSKVNTRDTSQSQHSNGSPTKTPQVKTLQKAQQLEAIVEKKTIDGPSAEFMERQMACVKKSSPMITDWDLYRKRNKLTKKDRIFICKEYYHFKKALLDRGWTQNEQYDSPIFHLKFTVKARDVFKMQAGTAASLRHEGHQLQDYQKVNHFYNHSFITSKIGLTQSLQQLHYWTNLVSVDDFYPKCYVINSNFRKAAEEGNFDLDNFTQEFRVVTAESFLKRFGGELTLKILVSLRIAEKRLLSFDDQIEQFKNIKDELLVTDAEWAILQMPKKEVIEKTEQLLKKQWLQDIQNYYSDKVNPDNAVEYVNYTIEKLAEKFPQTHLNGKNNVWMVKPGSKSRGRGITIHVDNFDSIIHTIKQSSGRQVVQKYIENPMIINSRKFDIRQWVLVTDWNPLTVWAYQECYIRLAATEYDPRSTSRAAHLTNNCVVQKILEKKDKEEYGSEDDDEDDEDKEYDNILSLEDFQGELANNYGPSAWQEKIWPQIKQCIKASTKSVQDKVDNRKNSFEFYGYDFMVDDRLNVWLLEVNSSPSMSTKGSDVLKHLVKDVLTDLAKVVVDWEDRRNADTGGFELLHRSNNQVSQKVNRQGLDLTVVGKKMNKTRS